MPLQVKKVQMKLKDGQQFVDGDLLFNVDAQAWARGKRNGQTVPDPNPANPDMPSQSNNAKYYSEQAAASATAAATSALTGNLAPDFASNVAYSQGDYVTHEGVFYRFTSDHAAGAWTGNDVEAIMVNQVLNEVEDATDNAIVVNKPATDDTKIKIDTTNKDIDLATMTDLENYVPLPEDDHDGTAGYVLRSNGDGSTDWVMAGTPTPDQTQAAVDEWMDENAWEYIIPDDSITEDKLNNNIKNTIKSSCPAKNFNISLGATLSYIGDKEQSTIIRWFENVKTFYSSIWQDVRIKYQVSNHTFILEYPVTDGYMVSEVNNYINSGGQLVGLRFNIYTDNLSSLFNIYGAETVCNAYATFIVSYIEQLPYSNNVSLVCMYAEKGANIFNQTYKTYILSSLQSVKNAGYYVSTPFANVTAMSEQNQDILAANDFISLDLYPLNNTNREKTSISEFADKCNYEYSLLERYLKNKDFYITETGCSSSWDSFENATTYSSEHIGKPISLWIQGLLQSKFASVTKNISYWYFDEAYKYAADTLLSIKYNQSVRYNSYDNRKIITYHSLNLINIDENNNERICLAKFNGNVTFSIDGTLFVTISNNLQGKYYSVSGFYNDATQLIENNFPNSISLYNSGNTFYLVKNSQRPHFIKIELLTANSNKTMEHGYGEIIDISNLTLCTRVNSVPKIKTRTFSGTTSAAGYIAIPISTSSNTFLNYKMVSPTGFVFNRGDGYLYCFNVDLTPKTSTSVEIELVYVSNDLINN